MSSLTGNAVVAQSGGPTAVINASACGVIEAALELRGLITAVYGANRGILGILHEDLFDLGAEPPEQIALLRATPAAAIGSCRFKLGPLDTHRDNYERLLKVFDAHDIRYFFYIGGNDSMDTADKVHRLAQAQGYPLRVIGIAKTIDNDLLGTDHCPGYGSAVKHLAACVMEAGRDLEAMSTFDQVVITEAMGRDTGWIAAATGLAQRHPDEAPHLIYVPEITFSRSKFLDDVRTVYRRLGYCYVVVSEGVKDETGQYLAADDEVDQFGHRQLGGAGRYLSRLVKSELGLKARYNRLDTCQRNAIHFASKTDSDEAYQSGREAVRQAAVGVSGKMVNLNRLSNDPYHCEPGLVDLAVVANGVRPLPREWLDAAGTGINQGLRTYVAPLLRGETPIRIGPDGLPLFSRFIRRAVPRRLPPLATGFGTK
ncbi:MAG: 6-phosphofructokinase [Gemmataceae bacterium]|nr:6-phosphofructokinase [Gemmataceae bacterium]